MVVWGGISFGYAWLEGLKPSVDWAVRSGMVWSDLRGANRERLLRKGSLDWCPCYNMPLNQQERGSY